MLPPSYGLLAAILAHMLLTPVLLTLATSQASAQAPRRDFSCVGAERLEDDVFAIPFRSGNAQVTEAARSGLAAAAQLIKAEPDRDVCVLGHSDREGGQTSNVRLAASRARAVAEALTAQYGIPAARLRTEARVAGFSRSTENRNQRNVTVVVLPARAPTPEPAPKQPPAAPPPASPAAPPAAAPAKPPPEKPQPEQAPTKPDEPKPAAEPKAGQPASQDGKAPAPSAPPAPAPSDDAAKPPADEKKPDQPGSSEAPKPAP